MIGSVAMMLEMSTNYQIEASEVWAALHTVMEQGYITADLGGAIDNTTIVSTEEFGSKVIEYLKVDWKMLHLIRLIFY